MKKQRGNLFLAMVVLITLVGCNAHQGAIKKNPEGITSRAEMASDYLIQPGDELDIKLFYNPELNETVTVRPDGKISVQLIDEIQASGLTPSQLDKILTEEYSKELKKPIVTVIVRTFTGRQVYVGGEVNKQGLVELMPGMSPIQAVINAGGLKETAKPEETIVIRKGVDNRPMVLRVDLANIFYGKGDGGEFKLKPFDIVYVPKSFIAKANKFVNQYIEELLLFRGVSLGFSYELHDEGVGD